MSDTILERINRGIQYREMSEPFQAAGTEEGKMVVEGHASTFNQPYTLYDDGEFRIVEQVDPHAFDGCDMSDVIFQYNHEGHVYARTRNNTLSVSIDNVGLFVRADLSGTEIGRRLYDEIKGGYTDRMSFGFTVAEDKRETTHDHENNRITVLRTITKVGRLYDCSAVSIPANDGTDISARSFADGIIDKIKADRLAARAAAEKLKAECLELLG